MKLGRKAKFSLEQNPVFLQSLGPLNRIFTNVSILYKVMNKTLIKVQFRGLELLKKKGALKKNFTYPGPLDLHQQIGDTILVDGLAPCVFFKEFVCWRHDRHRPPYCFHCQTAYASQRMIGWELSCTCIVMNHNVWFAESSRAPALWRHDWDVNQTWRCCQSFKGN